MHSVAGRELDALVAKQVMELPDVGRYSRQSMESIEWTHHGWNSDGYDYYYWLDDEYNPLRSVPPYSTDIAAAWQIVEKLKAIDVEFSLYYREWDGGRDEAHRWSAWFREGAEYQVYAPTAPLAICRAALLAVNEHATEA